MPGVELSWNGSHFVHRAVETVTDKTGRFAVGALEPGEVDHEPIQLHLPPPGVSAALLLFVLVFFPTLQWL